MADNANEILLSVVVYYELLCSVQFYGPIFLLKQGKRDQSWIHF